MRVIGFLLLLILAADGMQAGEITGIEAWVKDEQRDTQSSRTMLPYSAPTHDTGDRYRFTFYFSPQPGDYLRTLHIVPDDRIVELRINGLVMPLKQFPVLALSDLKNGIDLDISTYFPKSTNEVTVGIADMQKGLYGLAITRGTVFSFSQTVLMMAGGVFLILFSYCPRPARARFCYGYLCLGFFIISMLRQNHGMVDWKWYLEYLYSGLLFSGIVILVMAFPALRVIPLWIDRILQYAARIAPRYYVSLCVLLFFAVAAIFAQLLNAGFPHITDTQTQYMQAKLFAQGKLYEESHPLSKFFDFPFAVNNGKFYSQYFPGHPLLLALGMLAGAPWLVNPILGALTVAATYLLANEIAGRRAGYIAAILVMISPFIVFMSSEYMNHATTLLFLTLFLFGYIRLLKTGMYRYAALAGACVGYAFITRAQTTLPFALPIACHAMWQCARQPAKRWPQTVMLGLSFGFFVIVLLMYNYLTTGNPLVSAYQLARTDITETVLSFTPLKLINDAVIRIFYQLHDMHSSLFYWPFSSLFLAFLLYFFRAQKRYCGLLLACCLSAIGGLVFNPYNDGIYGPRYLYEISTSLIVLSSIALMRLPAIIQCMTKKHPPQPLVRGISGFAIALLFVASFPTFMNLYLLYARNYGGTNPLYYTMFLQKTQQPALVFVKSYDDYKQLFFSLPPRDDSPVIFAHDMGIENKKLIAMYPNRTVYKVNGWTLDKLP